MYKFHYISNLQLVTAKSQAIMSISADAIIALIALLITCASTMAIALRFLIRQYGRTRGNGECDWLPFFGSRWPLEDIIHERPQPAPHTYHPRFVRQIIHEESRLEAGFLVCNNQTCSYLLWMDQTKWTDTEVNRRIQILHRAKKIRVNRSGRW